MKHYSLTTYSYSELSENAKEKALLSAVESGKTDMDGWDEPTIKEFKEMLGGFNINVEEVLYNMDADDGCEWYDLDEQYDGYSVPSMFIGDFVINDDMKGHNDRFGFRESMMKLLSEFREELGDIGASLHVDVEDGYSESWEKTNDNMGANILVKDSKGEVVKWIGDAPIDKHASRAVMMMSASSEIHEKLSLMLADLYKDLYNINHQLNGAEGVASRLEEGDLQDVEFLKDGNLMNVDRDLLDA